MNATHARTVFGLSLRGLTLHRRTVALLLLNVLPLTAALASILQEGNESQVVRHLVGNLMLPVVVALVVLVLAGAAIGEERDDGTILYLTQTAVSRLTIVGAKLAAVWVAALLVTLPGTIAVAFVVGRHAPSAVFWVLVAIALTALAYSGLFVWLGLRLRRVVITGLAYIVLWEGSVASFARSANRLSISAYGRAIARRVQPGASWQSAAPVRPIVAILVLAVLAILAIWRATRRLERMELP